MVHYIYRIDILKGSLSNHYYIGSHSTNNINDGYRGSGKILHDWFDAKQRIEGEDYLFSIIEYNKDRKTNLEREVYHINGANETDPLCLNICKGGTCGPGNYKRQTYSKESYDKMVATRHKNNSYKTGGVKCKETMKKNGTFERLREFQKQQYINRPEMYKERGRKSGDTLIKNGSLRGNNNPNAMEYIVTNTETGEVKTFICAKECIEYLNISSALLSMIIHGNRKQRPGFKIESRRLRSK